MTTVSPLAETKPKPEIIIAPFAAEHIAGALRLSQEAGWPHRAQDWQMVLSVSEGVVAQADGEVVGTALCTCFGDVASVNMIIVDARMRGRGLGRRLMERVLELGGARELRLTATADGLPLYEKLGFTAVAQIVQHQGTALAALSALPVEVGAKADIDRLAAMDTAASGMERSQLLAAMAGQGQVLSTDRGFAILRPFGRGEVLGPIVAQDLETARALMSAAAIQCAGRFLRIDLPDPALVSHAESLGLAHVGGGTAMTKADRPVEPSEFKTYALASQALG
jgi:GNAT superfamily N-acetyltransferase